MKVTKQREVSFTPIKIEIVLESRAEYNALECLTYYTTSIPEFLQKEKGVSSDLAMGLFSIMEGINRALKG